MLDERLDDGMIEIGDPTEEPKANEPAPQVVIQYHERGGVPWMLVPPLLVISAVLAVLLYIRFAPKQVQPHSIAKAADAAEPLGGEPEPPVPPATIAPTPIANANPEPKVEQAPPSVAPLSNPVEPVVPASVPAPVEPTPEPVKSAEIAPFSRVQGLGFDPKALEAERKLEAPDDPALAPVVRQDRPDDRDLPREIDPDLLPPDPRQAKVRQQQRKLEMLKRVEDERFRFHADLKAICGKFREDSAPEILEMRKQYDLKIDPKAEKVAAELLGKNGKHAGADRRTRIELLRSLGYPEPVILDNIFVAYEKLWKINERDGPRDHVEAYYHAALFLLRNPPAPARPMSRAVSAPNGAPGPAR